MLYNIANAVHNLHSRFNGNAHNLRCIVHLKINITTTSILNRSSSKQQHSHPVSPTSYSLNTAQHTHFEWFQSLFACMLGYALICVRTTIMFVYLCVISNDILYRERYNMNTYTGYIIYEYKFVYKRYLHINLV